MIQAKAKILIEHIASQHNFAPENRDTVTTELDSFIRDGDDKAKLMGSMIKAYLQREWQFGRTPAQESLQRFVAGDFGIRWNSPYSVPSWDFIPPDPIVHPEYYQSLMPGGYYATRDAALSDRQEPKLLFDEALRNIHLQYHIVNDILERKLGWGEEGVHLSKTMAILLFDDASYPLPPTPKENKRMAWVYPHVGKDTPTPAGHLTNFCTLHGQQYLTDAIRTSGFNPFEKLTIAEVGGIKHQEDTLQGNNFREYFTITLGETPLTTLFAEYRNRGGDEFTQGAGEQVKLYNQEALFGDKKYDYFVTNMVVSLGSWGDCDPIIEIPIQRELVIVGNNITKQDGVSLHFGADLMSRVVNKSVGKENVQGEESTLRSNNLLKFMGSEAIGEYGDCHIICNRHGRVISEDALAAFEVGKNWEEYEDSKMSSLFVQGVGGKQPPSKRSAGNSRGNVPK